MEKETNVWYLGSNQHGNISCQTCLHTVGSFSNAWTPLRPTAWTLPSALPWAVMEVSENWIEGKASPWIIAAIASASPVTSYVCSLYQMRASFTKWNLYETCLCVVEKSTDFSTLGYTQYKINEFLCRPLQRIYVVNFSTTWIRVWCMELVRNLYLVRSLYANLSSSVPIYIRWIFRHLSKKIHSHQISTDTQ